ncbi:MAG: lipase family protein [Chitinophagales bacterium]
MVHATAINPKTACLLSSIAYCANVQQALNTYMKGWKAVWNPIAIKGTYAFVAQDPTQTSYVIAIRGSLLNFSWGAFYNWIEQDLNVATQVNWPYAQAGITNAKVSQGAWDALQDLQSMGDRATLRTLIQFLATLPPTASISVVGHSLGGNLATTTASWLYWWFNQAGKTRNNISVCTFAAPAAGNQFFAQDFNSKLPVSMRFESINDIVPKFPVASEVLGLRDLYVPSPAATEIIVFHLGYDMYLSYFFYLASGGIIDVEYKSGFYINNVWNNSYYTQPDGSGYLMNIPVSGKYPTNDVTDWLEEAAYQHSINQYSTALGVPLVSCVPSIEMMMGKKISTRATKAKPKPKARKTK